MNDQLEAIREAVLFIQNNWIGKTGIWRGEVSDFVGAVIKGSVTRLDIENLIKALYEGEPILVEDMGGTMLNNKLVEIWVSKCMD